MMHRMDTPVTVKMPAEMVERIEQKARQNYTSVSTTIRMAVAQFLDDTSALRQQNERENGNDNTGGNR